MRKIISLFIILSGISTVFAVELEYKTAMDAIRGYTPMLEQAVVQHDLPNAILYAKPLAEILTRGKVSEDSQPIYNGQRLTNVQAANYGGIGERKATPAEAQDICKALAVLAAVPMLQSWWTKNIGKAVQGFDIFGVIKAPSSMADPNSGHHQAVFNYFQAQVAKNHAEDPTKHRDSPKSDLYNLFWAAQPQNLGETKTFPHDHPLLSAYWNVVSVRYPSDLESYANGPQLKTLYPWIDIIYSNTTSRTFLKLKGITVVEGYEENKRSHTPEVWEVDPLSKAERKRAIEKVNKLVNIYIDKPQAPSYQNAPYQLLLALKNARETSVLDKSCV